MQSKAKTVPAYLKEVPAERKAALKQLRDLFGTIDCVRRRNPLDRMLDRVKIGDSPGGERG